MKWKFWKKNKRLSYEEGYTQASPEEQKTLDHIQEIFRDCNAKVVDSWIEDDGK